MAALAQDLGLDRVALIANKMRGEADLEGGARVRAAQRDRGRGIIPFDEGMPGAERAGTSPLDFAPEGLAVAAIEQIARGWRTGRSRGTAPSGPERPRWSTADRRGGPRAGTAAPPRTSRDGVLAAPPQAAPREYPPSFTRAWIRRTLPTASPAEARALLENMRRRGWTEAEVAERILPYMPPTPRLLRAAMGHRAGSRGSPYRLASRPPGWTVIFRPWTGDSSGSWLRSSSDGSGRRGSLRWRCCPTCCPSSRPRMRRLSWRGSESLE